MPAPYRRRSAVLGVTAMWKAYADRTKTQDPRRQIWHQFTWPKVLPIPACRHGLALALQSVPPPLASLTSTTISIARIDQTRLAAPSRIRRSFRPMGMSAPAKLFMARVSFVTCRIIASKRPRQNHRIYNVITICFASGLGRQVFGRTDAVDDSDKKKTGPGESSVSGQ